MFALESCKKDSNDPPSSIFSGAIIYNGKPIGLRHTAVYFELWQSGFGKMAAMNQSVAQDGSFSALLFDGDYKLVIPKSQGPFVCLTNKETNSDTILLTIKGSQQMNIEVIPYYTISNVTFSLAKDSTVTASCNVAKILTDARSKNIERISLYVNRTQFVDEISKVAWNDVDGSADLSKPITFTARIPNDIRNSAEIGLATQNYFYARIGVKISGVDDMIFSDIQKISF